MKRKLFALVIISIVSFTFVHGQIVIIPDVNFKNALLTHTPAIDTNNDGEIQVSEAEAFAFNSIATLDVSSNTALEMLYCQNNQITDLNINGLTNLSFLFCSDNQLQTLDVSTNVGLESLYCYSNEIETLNLNNNANLTDLMCFNNQLSVLDLSAFGFEYSNRFNRFALPIQPTILSECKKWKQYQYRNF